MLYQLTKFQCHIFFPSRDIRQNVLLTGADPKILKRDGISVGHHG